MEDILVNCRKVPFAKALGVSGYLLKLCTALSRTHRLTFVVNDTDEVRHGPAGNLTCAIAHRVVSFDDFECARPGLRDHAIELLPHHFQPPLLCDRSISICHDLHVFDVPWKYDDVESAKATFRRSLSQVSAVVTHFPRTYYAVERVAGIPLTNLFLTESPLLLDTSGLGPPETAQGGGCPTEVPELIYPAQLQAHKNHEALIRGIQILRARGRPVKLICPGSEFDSKVTEGLRSLVRRCGVEEQVQFVGRISSEALLDLYSRCTGVIVPSLAEGGAYVALEAIAAGKPVAVNDIESARMHISTVSGDVIWFDAMDAHRTADAIQQLVETDQSEFLDRNTIARERIGQMTWEGVAGVWDTIMAWLSGERGRPTLSIDKTGWPIAYR